MKYYNHKFFKKNLKAFLVFPATLALGMSQSQWLCKKDGEW